MIRYLRVEDDKERIAELMKIGKIPTDWWADDYLTNISAWKKERTGYPTQKPLALLNRIIKASSKEGDVVFDPFCGCATACVAAQQLNRKWIGCDIEDKAVDILVDRLKDDAGMFSDFVHTIKPPIRKDVEATEPSLPIKDRLYQEQTGKCNACYVEMEKRHLEIDHIIPKSKGGGNYYENYQLLCGHCNKVKSNNTMEYLLAKVAKLKRKSCECELLIIQGRCVFQDSSILKSCLLYTLIYGGLCGVGLLYQGGCGLASRCALVKFLSVGQFAKQTPLARTPLDNPPPYQILAEECVSP